MHWAIATAFGMTGDVDKLETLLVTGRIPTPERGRTRKKPKHPGGLPGWVLGEE